MVSERCLGYYNSENSLNRSNMFAKQLQILFVESKLLRIQKGKVPNKLSSRDILSRLSASRDDTTPISSYLTEPSVSVSLPQTSPSHPAISTLFCCCRHARIHRGGRVEASYTGGQGQVEVRDTIPLVLGDELLEND